MSKSATQSPRSRGAQREPFRLIEMLFCFAGVGVALAVTGHILVLPWDSTDDPLKVVPIFVRVIVAILAGISFAGVPLLLFRRTRRRTPWGPGKVAWFSQGVATWLLWPPIIYTRAVPGSGGNQVPWSTVCWLWGTPLMGLYVTAALLVGGWFSRRGRRRLKRNGREQIGLVLSCLWACTGLYLLSLLYWIDLFRRR